MAGVIDDWRTNRATFNDFEYPDDIGGSKEGAEGSRDGKLPSWAQWLRMFGNAGFPATNSGPNIFYSWTDYEWTEEDWRFVTKNIEKGTTTWRNESYDEIFDFAVSGQANYPNMTGYLAWWALGRADSTGDSPDMENTILSEITKNKKLPPYMADFFKKIKTIPEAMAYSTVRESVELFEFMLLMVGNIDDILEDSVITKNNGFAGFITKVNKNIDTFLKNGIEIESASYWDENSGNFSRNRTQIGDTWWDWLAKWWDEALLFVPIVNSLVVSWWAASALFGESEFEENAAELRDQMRETLGGGFDLLASPREVGSKIHDKAKEVLSGKDTDSISPFKEVYYNNEKVTNEKKLVAQNLESESADNSQGILATLREKIGSSSAKKVVRIETGINDTNLYKWSQEKSDVKLFVPSFEGNGLYTGPKDEVKEQINTFATTFNFFDSEKNLKELIRAWYQAGWYGYVGWFIKQKENDNKNKRYNQLETANLITKQVALGIAKIIAHSYDQYLKASIWVEATALLNTGDNKIDEDEMNAAVANAEKASENSIKNALRGGGLEEETELTSEQLKERQKFVKQCILMYNFESLRDNYRDFIKTKVGSDEIHSKGPFNYRFHALNNSSPDDGSNSLVTRLQMPPQTLMKPFLDITPDIQAFLVPKIRLFRINDSNIGLKEIEFVFDKIEDKQRIDQLLSAQFDRGNSYGIKSFDFSFEGSNPATARNDITANLSLYFQSFHELIRTRNHGQGDYRVIDLLVFPVNPNNRQGTKTIRAGEYDPSYYRIRADVGWAVPDNSAALSKVLANRGFDYEGLKNAILSTNKSFYLNAVDHEMDLKDDGSVEMKINYRAYAENALKTSKYDVLSSILLRKNREKFKEAMSFAVQDNNCSEEELKTLKLLFQEAEEELIKSTYKSLMKRLNERKKVFFVDVNENDISTFRKNGFFARNSPPRLIGVNGGSGVVQQGSVVDVSSEQEAANGQTNTNQGTLKLLKDGVEDYSPENLKIDNRINFFYLGDLIYTAMDSLYEDDGSLRKDIEKTAFLLGSFDTADAFNSSAVKEFNIIDIPVSVQYFYEWFTQNVIKTKRISYPIMDFVRDLTNDLVIKLLFDSCGRKPIDTKMRFNTATFLAIGKGEDNNIDTFIDFSKSGEGSPSFPVIDVAKHYGVQGGLPFLTDKQGNANINNFYNYVLIYPVKTSAIYGGVGNFFVDGGRGVHHFTIGRNKGLIKKIKFSKTDMNYIRESRFFRNGFDGLQQLSAVYKASIEMYGNTMYYPGMELYIDAVGIGGPEFRSNVPGSLAHILGFGGYHLVTRVNMNIAPGKFSTTVEAQWFHSGAKGDRALGPERPNNNETSEPTNSIEDRPVTTEGGDDEFTTKCSPLVSSLESYVESVKADPFAENEFAPNLESESSPPNSTSNRDSVSTTNTTRYANNQNGQQTSSNIDTVPNTGGSSGAGGGSRDSISQRQEGGTTTTVIRQTKKGSNSGSSNVNEDGTPKSYAQRMRERHGL